MALPAISWRRTMTLAAFTGLVLLAAAGFAVRERPAWQAARDARSDLAAGRYDDARKAADRWIRSRPGAAEAHYIRAKAAIALGRPRDLVDGLRQAQRLGFPDDRLAVLRALIDAQAGRLDQARPVLARAFNEATEPDLMVDEALARVLMELYDWPHAGAVLERWSRDAPADHRPPLWRAAVHRRRDADPEEIVADFREALRRAPGLPEARLGLAEGLARVGRHREAEPEFVAYLAQAPDDAAGQLGAGRNALELGDLDLAARRFERALALDPENGEAHIEQAKFDQAQGDDRSALIHLDRAIALRPFDPAPRYSRRIALNRLGRADEARAEQEALDRLKADLDGMESIQSRLNKSPDDVKLQCGLATWMFAHGFDQEGLKWSRKILADHPGHRETRALLSGYYEKQGNEQQASYYRARITPPIR